MASANPIIFKSSVDRTDNPMLPPLSMAELEFLLLHRCPPSDAGMMGYLIDGLRKDLNERTPQDFWAEVLSVGWVAHEVGRANRPIS